MNENNKFLIEVLDLCIDIFGTQKVFSNYLLLMWANLKDKDEGVKSPKLVEGVLRTWGQDHVKNDEDQVKFERLMELILA